MKPQKSRFLLLLGAAVVASLGMASSALAAEVCYQLPFPNPDLADGWGATAGRTNPHRGVDFPQPADKPIPAVADGVVRLRTSTSCLGNVVVIEHADGMFSGYAHLIRPAPVGPGTVVSKGQTIGNVGTTGTCTTGNHLHLTMSATLEGYTSGTTVDPYKYIQAHLQCGCDRSAGGLTFSCDGPNQGKTCVNVNEPADTEAWGDNFLCSDSDIGLAWSNAGAIPGKRCTNVNEAAENNASAWADNHICVPNDSAVSLAWSSAGPLPGMSCVNWNEPSEGASSWSDNFLCSAENHDFSAGDFTFSNDGPQEGQSCVQVDEPGDPHTWTDNYFCSKTDVGMKWSFHDPIAGMRCTSTPEAAEHDPSIWADNFLCLPPDSPYTFTWSSSGALPGQDCVRWYESSDLAGSWGDNYLCVTSTSTSSSPVEPTSANGGGAGGPGESSPSSAQRALADNEDSAESGCSVRHRAPIGPGAVALALGAAAAVLLRRRRR